MALRQSMDLQKKNDGRSLKEESSSRTMNLEKNDGFEMKYGFAEKKMMGICNVMKDYQEVWI